MVIPYIFVFFVVFCLFVVYCLLSFVFVRAYISCEGAPGTRLGDRS
jgi:hypothetical protein